MTFISVKPENGRVTFPRFSNVLGNFFENEFPAVTHFDGIKTPALVNTIETKDSYKVEVAAPGFEKEEIKISVEDHTLQITAEKAETKLEEGDKYTRKEFSFSTFKRHFTLPKTVNTEKIEASYVNGILTVTLPKIEEAKSKGTIEVKIG